MPTIAEGGGNLAGFDVEPWFGLFGPAGLPREIVLRLNQAFVAALTTPEIKTRLAGSRWPSLQPLRQSSSPPS